uniref:Adaptor related protein complex 3 subunit sigma 1 n=2 Tax=Strigops habroptila TaxID=2489341 RepID=A0A672V932_STRHB
MLGTGSDATRRGLWPRKVFCPLRAAAFLSGDAARRCVAWRGVSRRGDAPLLTEAGDVVQRDRLPPPRERGVTGGQEEEEQGQQGRSEPGEPGGRRPTMIKAILIFNNHGKPRLSKFYHRYSEDTQQQVIRETFHLVSKRDENVCNFLEGGLLIGGSDNKLIYRHYATLYFVFCVDSSESELGILDLIQVFVETLDKCFENVCELDLIFHVDKVHNILAEMVMGGMVLETNMNEIVTQIDAQNKLEKSETFIFQSPRQDR